jgi:hypothetical protein
MWERVLGANFNHCLNLELVNTSILYYLGIGDQVNFILAADFERMCKCCLSFKSMFSILFCLPSM